MGSFALMALLGFGFLFAVSGGSDEIEDDLPEDPPLPDVDEPTVPDVSDPLPPSEPPISDEGIVIDPNGQSTIQGGAGNDTLIADANDAGTEAIAEINMGAGDDVVDVNLPFGIPINGDAGDDTITSAGSFNTVDGGEGDDVITGGPADNLLGGEGNDQLSVSLIEIYDGSGTLDGGAGEDTISVTTDMGYSKSDFPSAAIVGGAGADAIELTLELTDGPFGDDTDLSTDTSTGITLSDFNADEDSLVIEINRDDANADREMISADIVTTEFEFQGETVTSTNLVMNFAATDTHGTHVATIRLGEDVNLTIDDIVFVQS